MTVFTRSVCRFVAGRRLTGRCRCKCWRLDTGCRAGYRGRRRQKRLQTAFGTGSGIPRSPRCDLLEVRRLNTDNETQKGSRECWWRSSGALQTGLIHLQWCDDNMQGLTLFSKRCRPGIFCVCGASTVSRVGLIHTGFFQLRVGFTPNKLWQCKNTVWKKKKKKSFFRRCF